jgi:hypothetical protein
MKPNFRFKNRPGQGQGQAGTVTAQQKIIDVAGKFGNNNLKNQQGTTRMIYDTLPLDGRTVFEFFQGTNARQFPFTNLNQDGGKLGVGESMVIERAYIAFVEFDPDTLETLGITSINNNLNWIQGEMNIMQGNSRVLKRIKLASFASEFNKDAPFGQDAVSDGYTVFHFDTFISIQPQLEFAIPINLAFSPVVENTYAQLVVEGRGGIFSPKANF